MRTCRWPSIYCWRPCRHGVSRPHLGLRLHDHLHQSHACTGHSAGGSGARCRVLLGGRRARRCSRPGCSCSSAKEPCIERWCAGLGGFLCCLPMDLCQGIAARVLHWRVDAARIFRPFQVRRRTAEGVRHRGLAWLARTSLAGGILHGTHATHGKQALDYAPCSAHSPPLTHLLTFPLVHGCPCGFALGLGPLGCGSLCWC